MINTLEDAEHELWAMQRDVAGDFGEEAADEATRDLIVSVCWNLDNDDLAREFCRIKLGYIPYELEPRLGKIDWLDGMDDAEVVHHWGGAPFGSTGS